jgi:hypothetical protein
MAIVLYDQISTIGFLSRVKIRVKMIDAALLKKPRFTFKRDENTCSM